MISRGDFESLNGLVQSSSIETIKQNYSKLSTQQKESIATRKEDIQMSTPHLFETATPEGSDRSYVKIGIAFQIVPGLSTLLEEAKQNPNALMELTKKIQTDLIVADYQ